MKIVPFDLAVQLASNSSTEKAKVTQAKGDLWFGGFSFLMCSHLLKRLKTLRLKGEQLDDGLCLQVKSTVHPNRILALKEQCGSARVKRNGFCIETWKKMACRGFEKTWSLLIVATHKENLKAIGEKSYLLSWRWSKKIGKSGTSLHT